MKSRAEILLDVGNGHIQTTCKLSLKLGMASAVNTDHMKTL